MLTAEAILEDRLTLRIYAASYHNDLFGAREDALSVSSHYVYVRKDAFWSVLKISMYYAYSLCPSGPLDNMHSMHC